MKKTLFIILSVCLLTTTVYSKSVSIITMTTETMTTPISRSLNIHLAGSGTVTIDWGDGSEITVALKEYKRRWFRTKNEYSYVYANQSSHIITIKGENITHLSCRRK
jgi:predicted membrane protein